MKTDKYKNHLILDEKSEATVSKYVRDVTAYIKWLDGREMSKELTMEYKEELEKRYEATSVNTMLSALNSYFDWIGHPEYKVKNIKTQKDEVLRKIIEARLLAPSSRNLHPVEFIVVKDKQMLYQLARAKTAGSGMLKGASCAVVVIGDSKKSDAWVEDCSIAMTYMMLRAVCVIGLHTRSRT